MHPDGINLTSTFRYDLLGNKVASIDPYGQETHYFYDNQNRLIQTVFPIVSIAQNGTKTFYQYDPFDRLIGKIIYSAQDAFIQAESKDYNTFHFRKLILRGSQPIFSTTKQDALQPLLKGKCVLNMNTTV